MFLRKKRMLLIILAVSIVLFLAGALFDEQISSALFNIESPFGLFFAGMGEFPCVAAAFLSAELFVLSADKERKNHMYFCYGCAGLVGLFGLLIAKEPLDHYSTLIAVIAILVQIALAALVCFLFYKKILELPRNDRMRLAMFIAGALLLMIACVAVLKLLWGRPRYRSVSVTNNLDFRPVWAPSHSLAEGFPKLEHDEFRSFPSSHTSCAAAVILISALISYIPSMKRYGMIADIIALVYVVIVAFSRIVMGAHYLSDVSFGWLVMLGAAYLMARIFLRNMTRRKKKAA